MNKLQSKIDELRRQVNVPYEGTDEFCIEYQKDADAYLFCAQKALNNNNDEEAIEMLLLAKEALTLLAARALILGV